MSERRPLLGSAATEFALMVPILIGFGGAIVDYGTYFHQQNIVQRSVREGCRFAASRDMTRDDPVVVGREQAAETLQAMGMGCDGGVNCQLDAWLGSVAGLDTVTVRMEVTFDPWFGLLPVPSRTSAQVTMALEDQRW